LLIKSFIPGKFPDLVKHWNHGASKKKNKLIPGIKRRYLSLEKKVEEIGGKT